MLVGNAIAVGGVSVGVDVGLGVALGSFVLVGVGNAVSNAFVGEDVVVG